MMFYKTVENQAEIEIIIEKSRFIGHIIPINWHEHSDMDSLSKEAEDFILSIRNKHKEATHNVPVYVIGLNYEVQKYSDDGEPSKTAGIPILEMLKNEGIMNVVLVITRYFGGTKLGTGGLVRAYTSTAKLALEEARVIKKEKHDLVQIVAAYTALGKIQNELAKQHFIIKESFFHENITLHVYCPVDRTDMLKDRIRDITNGDGIVEIINTEYITNESEM